jgi:hypothetical protein
MRISGRLMRVWRSRLRPRMEGHMRIPGRTSLRLIFALAISSAVTLPAAGSSGYKCKRPACDINAIGHRALVNIPSVGDWFSLKKEKELGDRYAAELEQKVEIVKDEAVASYVDRVAQHIAQNSDADMPITIRIIRRSDVGVYTLPAGHIYITTGLLLKLRSEGELASVLARGVAHTALHSVMRLQSRANLLTVSIPSAWPDNTPIYAIGNNFSRLGLLKFQRDFELEADYFGVQYLYKSNYDTDCFLSAVRTLWEPDPRKPVTKAFSPFPPLTEVVKPLQKEIEEMLPKRPGDVVSTPEFGDFEERIQRIAPPESEQDARPKLIRDGSPATD